VVQTIKTHVQGLLTYLSNPDERANEDLALLYFRTLFGEAFLRQKDAKKADGYVPGAFVLELKGKTNDWLAGLFQGLAYQNHGLDFAQVVVAAKGFLAVWQVRDIPEEIRSQIAAAAGAPNAIGREFARTYANERKKLLQRAIWNGSELFAPLFEGDAELISSRLRGFAEVLRKGKKVRERITLRNFPATLREMTAFFDPAHPVRAVRAFYSMIYAWDDVSTLQISNKAPDQATLRGETITSLRPAKRTAFKDFVEGRYVSLEGGAGYDDFFAKYDTALDAVDADFRRKHGIFFTDLYLSKLAMWLIKQHIPKLGKDYLVLDPACGSGNLVTNWRTPLELRHKVVSEIEPELLFAVEQRMNGDRWHDGRFTVVPKVSENRGLNFLDKSADDYLTELTAALAEKGQAPDKPIAFLCNPPYRSDDDQSATGADYTIHPTILALTGADAASERYCCFLAQMKLICQQARTSGLPGESLLLLFTKSAWLTNRSVFKQIRLEMLSHFENVTGLLVDGSEFFDVKGKWPVAFTVWRYKGEQAQLNAERSIPLMDLTWLKRRDLIKIDWTDARTADLECKNLFSRGCSQIVALGEGRRSIRSWSDGTMVDFKRDRRKSETNEAIVGGLPSGDHRRGGKKTYGESDGQFIGFMDDLTPCRVKRSTANRPWFRLNGQFMDVKKNRCLSGPPTNRGYCADNLETARKLFFWYAATRTFLQHPYPMWVDADDLWAPHIPPNLQARVFACSAAIVFAENECVQTYFPANNPIVGDQELHVSNPLNPLNTDSFWHSEIRPAIIEGSSPAGDALIRAVNDLYGAWKEHLGPRHEIPIAYKTPYFIDDRPLTRDAGLVQIKDYAIEYHLQDLLAHFTVVQTRLRAAKKELDAVLRSTAGLNYFGPARDARIEIPQRTSFDRVLARRLALAGMIVRKMEGTPSFGRTKLAKVFYLADKHAQLPLETTYVREAAGPLETRAFYNEKVGIEALAYKHGLFRAAPRQNIVRYEGLESLKNIDTFAQGVLGDRFQSAADVIEMLQPLTTDQSEIVATLYACWDDLLIHRKQAADNLIISDFLQNWHPKKARFSSRRLRKALCWMREVGLVPSGSGKPTSTKHKRDEFSKAEF